MNNKYQLDFENYDPEVMNSIFLYLIYIKYHNIYIGHEMYLGFFHIVGKIQLPSIDYLRIIRYLIENKITKFNEKCSVVEDVNYNDFFNFLKNHYNFNENKYIKILKDNIYDELLGLN